jgi:tetratricopeptide (TPR) repeat protein
MRITKVIILTLALCILHSGCNSEPSTTQVNDPVASNSESSRDAIFYNNRGLAYKKQGELDKAIADYNKAIELDPQLAVAYYNRGKDYEDQGELDKAIADFTKAIELDPTDAVTYTNRGIAYRDQGELGKAEADFTKAKELGYEPE